MKVDSGPYSSCSVGLASAHRDDAFIWMNQRQECSVEAIITDPPYGILEYTDTEQDKLRSGRGGVWRIPPTLDGIQRAPLPRFTILNERQLYLLREFYEDLARCAERVLVPGGHLFVASNALLAPQVSAALDRVWGLEYRGTIIRLVTTMRGGDRPKNAHVEFEDVSVMPRSMHEPWLLFRKRLDGTVSNNLRKWGTGGLRRVSSAKPFGDVIRSSPTPKRERDIARHPSLKPQAFLRSLVRASLPLNLGTVLDPFCGSGSLLAAANALGVKSIGVESDRAFFADIPSNVTKLSALEVSVD